MRSLGVAVAGLVCLGGGIGACSSKVETPEFENAPLVVVSLDTVRADAVAGYGAPSTATPAMAALGKESVRFEHVVAATHHTAPSHATILTGFSPDVHRTPNSSGKVAYAMPREVPTLAEILQSHGYKTAAFLDSGNLLAAGGFDRGFTTFHSDGGGLLEKRDPIERFLAAQSANPFFLFVHTYRAHQPYQAPSDLFAETIQGYQGKLLNAARGGAKLSRKEAIQNHYVTSSLDNDAKLDEQDRRFLERLYRAGVTGADRELEAFFGWLKAAGVYDRCILVVTSDHGEAFGEHGTYDHKDVFDENLLVPLWIRLPGGLRGGKTVPGIFSQLHLAPTLLGLLGIEPRVPMEGRDRASALFGEALPNEAAYSAWFAFERRPLGFAVRSGNQKLIELMNTNERRPLFDHYGAPLYFDLAADPKEAHNRVKESASEARPLHEALVSEREHWEAIRRLLGISDSEGVELDSEAARQLRAIGYNR